MRTAYVALWALLLCAGSVKPATLDRGDIPSSAFLKKQQERIWGNVVLVPLRKQ